MTSYRFRSPFEILSHLWSRRKVAKKPAARRAAPLQIELLEDRVTPSTLNFVVNTLAPTAAFTTGTSGGIVDAVNAANADTVDSEVSITFNSSVFTGVARTIDLTGGLTLNPTNQSLLVTIDATSVGGVTLNGGGTFTDLSLTAGTTDLTDLTITNGFASQGLVGNGGGIENSATLTINNSTISGNSANGASGGGGGGGGIFNNGTLTISDSTISGNTAFGSVNGAYGGGIFNGGTLNLTDATVANNASSNGGGGIEFAEGSHATLVNDTITGNGILSFGSGAGLDNNSGNAISLTNTIVAANAANGDLADGVESSYSGSFDILGDNSSLSNLTNSQNNQYPASLPLAPLNYYGGPTETVALLGAPFVGTATGAPTTDQRGFANLGSVDIGAYQSQTTAVDFVVTTANDPGVPGLMSLRGAIDLADLQTSSVVITFAATYDIQITVPTSLYLNNSNAGVTVTIDATSIGGVTVNGGGSASNFSVFEIDAGTVNLTDLTISNGNTNNSSGGIYNDSTLSLMNCTFTDDSAGNEGGGLYNEDTLTIANCTFKDNSANFGGGLFNNATLTMSDTTITDNSLTGTGGGAGFGNEGEATLTDCTITDNTGSGSGDVGGGVLNYYLLTITGGTISGNSAFTSGGGIEDAGTSLSVMNCTISDNNSASGAGVYTDATTTITSSQITGNTSTGIGGGISDADESTVTVTATTISGNHAAGNGGGIFNLGTLSVANSTLSANVSAADGGGIAHFEGTAVIINSTLSGNADGGGGGEGGGIAAFSTGVTVLYSTLSGNSASNAGGGIWLGSPVRLINTIVANSTHGDLAGGIVAVGSTNNLIDDAATGSGLTNGVAGNIVNKPASLGPLANNGGPTQTFNLLTGSLALHAGTALALTALGDAVDSTDTTLPIASSPDLGVGLYVRIDNEIVLITGIPSSNSLTVLRGQLGTTAAAHNAEAPLVLAADQRGDLRSALTPDIGSFERIGLSLGTLSVTQWTAGQAYSATIAIINSTGALSHFTFTGLPTGLHATLTGTNIVLSGAATQTGVFTLHASVTDSTSAIATGTFTLTIVPAPTIGNLTVTAWTVNASGYSGTLTISSGTAPYTIFGVPTGLPPGLTAAITGAVISITGTPTVAGTYHGSITVIDSVGAKVTKTFTIVINPPMAFGANTLPVYYVNSPYLQSLPILSAIKGGTGPITYRYETPEAMPPGLSFNAMTGVFSGTATALIDPLTFIVFATDAAGETIMKSFTLTGAVGPATVPTNPQRRGSSA